MKRLIRCTSDTPEGFRKYLQQFVSDDFTEEDIEEMVRDAYNPANAEELLTPEVEREIYKNYGRRDGDEICRLIELGHSVDDAIQTVIVGD